MRPPNANEGRALDKNMYMTNSFNGSALQTTAEAGVSKLPETYICSVELHRTKVELGCWRKRRCQHAGKGGPGADEDVQENVERNEKGENPDPGQGKGPTS